jgi:hypothetical protein
MVPIKTCLSLPEALVVRSYFQDHGIVAALNVYYHGSVAWHHIFALNGIQLSVLDVEFDRARQLMVDAASLADEQDQPDAEGPAARPTLFQIAAAMVVLLLAGLPLPLWSRRRV